MNTCPHCERSLLLDGEFWKTIRQCSRCGKFTWDKAEPVAEKLEEHLTAVRLQLVFFYIGFAAQMHEQWLQKPWLTAPLCVCHPDLYVRY